MLNSLFKVLLAFLLLNSITSNAAEEIPLLSDITLDSSYAQHTIRGQLRPSYYTVISAGISAKLLSFPVVVGQLIEMGQEVARYDCAVQDSNVAIAIARRDASKQRTAVNERL